MSSGGLQFGILEIIASFGNVWADQSYWQVTTLLSIRSGCAQAYPGAHTRGRVVYICSRSNLHGMNMW